MANTGKLVIRAIAHPTPSGTLYQFVCQWGHRHASRVECAACSRQPWTGSRPPRALNGALAMSIPARTEDTMNETYCDICDRDVRETFEHVCRACWVESMAPDAPNADLVPSPALAAFLGNDPAPRRAPREG